MDSILYLSRNSCVQDTTCQLRRRKEVVRFIGRFVPPWSVEMSVYQAGKAVEPGAIALTVESNVPAVTASRDLIL